MRAIVGAVLIAFGVQGQTAKSHGDSAVTLTNVTVQPGQNTKVDIGVNASGTLFAQIPDAVTVNEPFKIDVWYEPSPTTTPTATTTVPVATVTFDRGSNVVYDPTTLTLQPFRRATVSVTIKKASSGLARIAAYSGCCVPLTRTVVCDFKGRVRALDPSTLESRLKQPVSVVLEDNQDRPLTLDADLDLRIAAFNCELSSDGSKWQNTIMSRIKKGAGTSDFFYVRPTPVDVAAGHIQVTGYGQEGAVAFSDDLTFTITPPWWLRLSMAMLGAFLYALYKRLNAPAGKNEIETLARSLGAALLSGVFAYELASLDVFGIKLDTTSLHGFVVLGLLTAYVGVEPLLDKLVKRQNERAAGSVPSNKASQPSG